LQSPLLVILLPPTHIPLFQAESLGRVSNIPSNGHQDAHAQIYLPDLDIHPYRTAGWTEFPALD
jgi:hypothetical protein